LADALPPLIAVAGAPVPDGMAAAWILGSGGVRLRTALLPARGSARGAVVINTGRTESLEKYFETAADLSARGFAVLLHDWRGQGLSGRLLADRLRGHAEDFDDFLADFRRVLDAYEDRLPRPWLLVGHSMGGALSLLALARGERRFSGAVLAAPMFGIVMSRVNRLAARPLSRLMHAFGRGGEYVSSQAEGGSAGFDGNPLTHDRVRYGRMYDLLEAEPRLALGGPTWSWLNSALKAMAWLRRAPAVSRVTIPVTILSAEADSIVDNATQPVVAARLPNARLVTVVGAYHEILQETDERRSVFFQEFEALADAVAPLTAPQGQKGR
jgi:alpha-beta hydrolase superfamily lysophospholipase